MKSSEPIGLANHRCSGCAPTAKKHKSVTITIIGDPVEVSIGVTIPGPHTRFTFRSAKRYTAFEIPPPDPAMYSRT